MTTKFQTWYTVVGVLLWVSQATGQTSITDGIPPAIVGAGSPAGSYALSGFDTVNMFSGNLNVALPLLKVGGRGEAGYTMVLPVNRRWRIETHPDSAITYVALTNNTPIAHWWSDNAPPAYSPGILAGRYSKGDPVNCGGTTLASLTLTRLTFIATDGTETELVDEQTGGVIQTPASCSATGPSRGAVFVARDGSATKFVAANAISDSPVMSYGDFYPSGVLYFRNGVRYQILGGLVQQITDRNGNQVTLTYNSTLGALTSVQDSIGRTITIAESQTLDTLTFKGAGGMDRTIKIAFGQTSTVLDPRRTCVVVPTCTLASLNDLFGTYGGNSSPADLIVVTSVTLPDNVQKYQFLYNDYSELSQMTLPTGGVIRYVHGPGAASYSVVNNTGRPYVYRRLLSRDAYPDGSHLEQHTVYSAAYSNITYVQMPYYLTTVTVSHYAGLNADIGTTPPITMPLGHDRHYFFGGPSNPNVYPLEIPYPFWLDGREDKSEELDFNGTTVLRTISNTWAQRTCEAGEHCLSSLTVDYSNRNGSLSPTDPRLTEAKRTLDVGQASSKVASIAYLYDRYNNRTQSIETAYGATSPGAALRQVDTNYETGAAYTTVPVYLPGLPLSETITSGGTQYARTDYEYDQYSADSADTRHAALTPRDGIIHLDPAYLMTGTPPAGGWVTKRGNLTAATQWNGAGASMVTSRQYDAAGSVVQTADGKNNATTIDYGDGSPFAFPAAISDALTFKKKFTWESNLGQLTNTQEQIGAPPSGTPVFASTTATFAGLLDRVSSTTRPDSGATGYTYDDANRTVTTTTSVAGDLNCPTSLSIVSDVLFDGLGRKFREVRHNPDGTTYQDVQYDGMGRVNQVSNPYCASSVAPFCTATTAVWTATAYDALSRVKQVTGPDGSHTGTTYSGNQTTTTDPNGHDRVMQHDSLGRLVFVTEANNVKTRYSYDALDNLLKVEQGLATAFDANEVCTGCQTRTFEYFPLKRLKHAQNPETGDINYTYDANGNLLTKTDARQVVTTYTYDALNRPTVKSYTGSTPAVAYTYEDSSVTNSVHRLTKVTATDSSVNPPKVYASNYGPFDVMGRPLESKQTTPGSSPFQFYYGYNQAGGSDWMKYPSNRQVTTC